MLLFLPLIWNMTPDICLFVIKLIALEFYLTAGFNWRIREAYNSTLKIVYILQTCFHCIVDKIKSFRN